MLPLFSIMNNDFIKIVKTAVVYKKFILSQ